MLDIVRSLLGALRATMRTHRALALENLALRHQLTVLQRRTHGRTRLTPADRLLWVWLARSWRGGGQGRVLLETGTAGRRVPHPPPPAAGAGERGRPLAPR